MRIRLLALAVAGSFLVSGLTAAAATLQEDFSSDPATHGWRGFGNTNLFVWNSTNQNLEVTWDSSQTNSYFYHWLGNVLAMEDQFTVEFDLQLQSIQWTGTFELAVGLFNFGEAISPDFSRATGNSPNLFEFDYFPDDGLGEPNLAGTVSDLGVNATNMSGFYFIWDASPMQIGTTYHVQVSHVGSSPPISVNVFTNGQLYSSAAHSFPGTINDFRLDTFAAISYSAAGDTFGDSILAHGTVDNVRITLPPPPVTNISGGFSGGKWQVQFTSRTNWLYTLERTLDLETWTAASGLVNGNGSNLTLQDSLSPIANALYRIKAARP